MPTKGLNLTTSLLVEEISRHIVALYNSTVKRILSPRHQRGGTVMMTFGGAVASSCTVDRDKTKLGSVCWTKLGDSRKTTYMITMYMSHNKDTADTKRQMVWD